MKRKKQTCVLLIVMFILSVAMVGVDAENQLPKIFVHPPIYTATQLGEVFTIDVNITNVHDLRGYEFKLGYNTTLLDALNASEGPFPPAPRSITINEPEGYVWVYGFCESTDGNGTLVTITFNVTYPGRASCTLDLFSIALFDSNIDPIAHEVEDGYYEFMILGITVATHKPSYALYFESIEIYGNLTLSGLPYEGLVALQIRDPMNYSVVARTIQTGTTPPPGDIIILQVTPCDSWGNPKSSFKRGTLAYFNVTVRNNSTEYKNVTITVNVYDGNMVPISMGSIGTVLGPGIWPGAAIVGVIIPDWAYVGTGIVYANAFSDWPRDGGVPYCPEKSATLQITNSPQGTTSLETQVSGNSSTGNYELTFKLAAKARIGVYSVYASSFYRGQKANNSTTFDTHLLGDVDGDDDVDIIDVGKVAMTFATSSYNVTHDLDEDGDVDIIDVGKVAMAMAVYGA